MLVKFGAEPYKRQDKRVDGETGSSSSNSSGGEDDQEEDAVRYHANSEADEVDESRSKNKKPKKKRAPTPVPVLPFYEDYHMVDRSDDEVDRTKRSGSGSSSEDEQRVERPRKKRKVDPELVQEVLQLINAAKGSSGGRAEAAKDRAESQAKKAQGDNEKASKKLNGGAGGRYSVVKTPTALPAKTKKSLESIARQVGALKAKIDELTQQQ